MGDRARKGGIETRIDTARGAKTETGESKDRETDKYDSKRQTAKSTERETFIKTDM